MFIGITQCIQILPAVLSQFVKPVENNTVPTLLAQLQLLKTV